MSFAAPARKPTLLDRLSRGSGGALFERGAFQDVESAPWAKLIYRTGMTIASVDLFFFLAGAQLGTIRTLLTVLLPGWTLIALMSSKLRWRPSLLFNLFVVLQVWALVATAHSAFVIQRDQVLGRHQIFLLQSFCTIAFYSVLFTLRPDAIRAIVKVFIWIGLINALFAYMQFVNLGPAIKVGNFYSIKDIEAWDNVAGVRAVGLTQHPNFCIFLCYIALAVIASAMVSRKLKWFELMALPFLAGTVVVCQGRAMVPPAFLVVSMVFILILARYRGKGVVGCLLFLSASGLMAPIIAPKLGYTMMLLQGTKDQSLVWRQDFVWRSVGDAVATSPIFGVGPDSGTFAVDAYRDRWVPNTKAGVLENGYIMMIQYFGVPALAMVLAGIAVGFFAILNRLLQSRNPKVAEIAVIQFATLVSACFILAAFNTWDVPNFRSWVFALLAMSAPFEAVRRRQVGMTPRLAHD